MSNNTRLIPQKNQVAVSVLPPPPGTCHLSNFSHTFPLFFLSLSLCVKHKIKCMLAFHGNQIVISITPPLAHHPFGLHPAVIFVLSLYTKCY
jgi:hypothetical protein